METIVLKPLNYKGRECIGIYFAIVLKLNNIMRKLKDCQWSQTNKCWLIPCDKQHFDQLYVAIKGKALIDSTALRCWLEERKKTALTLTKAPKSELMTVKIPAKVKLNAVNALSTENQAALQQVREILQLKMYSPNTIKTYCGELGIFLQQLKHTAADTLSAEKLQQYFLYCVNTLQLEENTIHSRMNALKFYYEQVLHREKMFFNIPRPKKPLLLPRFFNQDEIAGIINATVNIKHKAMLMLTYSAGLRVSETVTLKTANINRDRMCIFVENAKGKKDRVVTLSPVLLIILREYWKIYKPKADGYLFEGQTTGQPYSARSLQLILDGAKQKAGIKKEGGVHALRHSFATHLLDKGTDVTMIMKLLGHNDLKTTLRYLHVTNRDLIKVLSPLDNLKLE